MNADKDDTLRELAREMLEECPGEFVVDERAILQRVPDGAYVEVWMWVPNCNVR